MPNNNESKAIDILKNAPRDKDGNLITDRNEYLKSLPQCEFGLPVINHEEFDALAWEFDWEYDFIENYLIGEGVISAWDYDEFHHITD